MATNQLLSLILLVLFTLVLKVSSLSILVPLYLSPANDAWKPLLDAVAANPKAHWQVIVNPNSGAGPNDCPGEANAKAGPDFQAGLAKLNNFPNVGLLGYVPTRYGTRAIEDVASEIEIYGSWANCPGPNVTVSGIFFDEFGNSTTTSPPNAMTKQYAQQVSSYAYADVPTSASQVIFNPGNVVPKHYFEYCDTVVTFEGHASNYSNPKTLQRIKVNKGAKSLTQNAIIIHDAPKTLNVRSIIEPMASKGVEAVYITQDSDYKVLNTTLLMELAAAVIGRK